MEGSLASSPSMSNEGSGESFPTSVDFWPLHCYFDRLERKFVDPVLLGIGEDVTEQVCRLKTKQDAVEEWVETVLQDMFGTSLIENLEVSAGTVEDAAMLKLLLGTFELMEESIENKIALIARNSVLAGKVSVADLGHLIVSQQPVPDSDSIQVSLPEDAASLGVVGLSLGSRAHEKGSWAQDMVAMLLAMMRRVSSSSRRERNDDGRASTVEGLSNISEAMEQLRGILQQGMEQQEATPHPESGSDDADVARITVEARVDHLKDESVTDVDALGRGLQIHCDIPESDEKFKRTLEIETASCKSGLQGGAQGKLLPWMKEGYLAKEDYELMSQITHRADILEHRLGTASVDLFLLFKRHDREVFKTFQFKIGSERLSGEDETRVVKNIADLLEMAEEEHYKVRRIDRAVVDVESTEKEGMLVDELVSKFKRATLNLEAIRKYPSLRDSRQAEGEEISKLDRGLKEAGRDLEEIGMKMDELETRFKYGKFGGVMIGLANAVSHWIRL